MGCLLSNEIPLYFCSAFEHYQLYNLYREYVCFFLLISGILFIEFSGYLFIINVIL